MLRRIKQWWCGRRGHPYGAIFYPIVKWPDDEVTKAFCKNCGAFLYEENTKELG